MSKKTEQSDEAMEIEPEIVEGDDKDEVQDNLEEDTLEEVATFAVWDASVDCFFQIAEWKQEPSSENLQEW